MVAEKNPGIAAVLAALPGLFGILGIGHFYVGRIRRAIILLIGGLAMGVFLFIFLIAGMMLAGEFDMPSEAFAQLPPTAADIEALGLGMIVATVIVGIGYLAVWIWSIYDAYNIAKKTPTEY